MWKDVIGWLSSGLLVLTVGHQVLKQWRAGSSEGVSRWLFIGQLAASTGFIVYSLLVHSIVFVATNGLMLLNGLAGYGVVLYHRRRERLSGGKRRTAGAASVVAPTRLQPRPSAARRRSPRLRGVATRSRSPRRRASDGAAPRA